MAQTTQKAAPPQRTARVQTRVGRVTSDVCDKTIKVQTDRLVEHLKYGKYQRRRTVVHVHDPKNEAKNGDTVEIAACRPISKTKSWRLVRIVRRGDESAAGVGRP